MPFVVRRGYARAGSIGRGAWWVAAWFGVAGALCGGRDVWASQAQPSVSDVPTGPVATSVGAEVAGAPASTAPWIAHWTFDETSGTDCRDAGPGQHTASAAHPAAPGFSRTDGVFGAALRFSGNHDLRVPGKPSFEGLSAVSFSAWVLPEQLTGYREIFRKEDGDRRVLFSFQHDGTILALGLNVGGYVECDARLAPQRALDGAWHHCAATFDGRTMRVYFDGREIGSLERPGAIDARGQADGCIGSTNGGECFQGAIDDLRIHGAALSAEEVRGLFEAGLRAQAERAKQLDAELASLYARGESFAATAAECRRRFARHAAERQSQTSGAPTFRLARGLLAQLRADFPGEFDCFAAYVGRDPVDYLTALGNEFHEQAIGRVVSLMLEYKPLVPEQWARQTAEERAFWREADAVAARFEALRAGGEAAWYAPEWIELAFEAGRRVAFRPLVQEAVAPYVPPETPPTRTLSADEAQAALRRDWLHQIGGRVTPEAIRDELHAARRLAARIEGAHPGRVDFASRRTALDAFERRLADFPPDRLETAYFELRALKREILFSNPVVDFDRLLLVDMPMPQGSEWRHETRHRLGYMAVPGGRLLVVEGLHPGGAARQLMPQPPLHGSFWRPDLSWDAQRVLFCFKPHNEKSFRLYEIRVDGTGLKQLTFGPYDDLDPIYLPDERHILFTTTRGHTYVRCMPPTNAFVLARADADGRNIYLISANNEPDYLPSVMNDGRIVYTRWEYTDKPPWRAQGLWTVNPDGTQPQTFWGNQSVWPDLLKDARSIPGSRRVMFTGSAHHDWFSGSVGIIDPDRGFNFPDGLTKVTAEVAWPESGNGPVDPVESPEYRPRGAYRAYHSPYPLSEQDFLVSAEREGKFVLYLMDTTGNRELVYEGVHHVFHAMPLRPRPRPPVVADRVAWPSRQERLAPTGGVIYSADVYSGAPESLRGKARRLRVLGIEHKTYTYWHQRPYVSTGPVVSAVQSDGVKRILGTVPIEPDGSVAFEAPSGIPLHFQLLDAEGRALQTMRSFANVMPGERRGCLGCHESHSRAPAPEPRSAAAWRRPQPITPPPWGDESISYPRFVVPVLEKYCGSCHVADHEGRKTLDLTERPGFHIFTEPYLLLIGRPTWGTPYRRPENPPPGFGIAGMLVVEGYDRRDPAAYRTPEPMTALSYRSRLIHLATSGEHYGVKVDALSRERLIAWVDAMCPFAGEEEIRQLPDPEFQGVDWLAIRPRIRTAPKIVRPGPVD